MATGVIGTTIRFEHHASKDGLVWDLSAAVVTLTLKKPTGAVLTKAATVDTPGSAGICHYVTQTGDVDTPGTWTYSWLITDGAVVQETPPRALYVVDSP